MTDRSHGAFRDCMGALFNHFNSNIFGGAILRPSSLYLDPSKGFTCRWQAASGSIVAGAAAVLSCVDFHVDYLHELVHLLRFQRDGVVSGHYHDRFFANEACSAGLFVQRHPTHGWSLTTLELPKTQERFIRPSDGARERLALVLQTSPMGQSWQACASEVGSAIRQQMPSKKFLLKYVCDCPPPHNSIRCGRRPGSPQAPDITCNRCGGCFRCSSS